MPPLAPPWIRHWDQLEQALGSRQVIEYASQDAATPTALPSPTPIPLSHLFLLDSAGDMLLLLYHVLRAVHQTLPVPMN